MFCQHVTFSSEIWKFWWPGWFYSVFPKDRLFAWFHKSLVHFTGLVFTVALSKVRATSLLRSSKWASVLLLLVSMIYMATRTYYRFTPPGTGLCSFV